MRNSRAECVGQEESDGCHIGGLSVWGHCSESVVSRVAGGGVSFVCFAVFISSFLHQDQKVTEAQKESQF